MVTLILIICNYTCTNTYKKTVYTIRCKCMLQKIGTKYSPGCCYNLDDLIYYLILTSSLNIDSSYFDKDKIVTKCCIKS